MCRLLVGLPAVDVLGVVDLLASVPLVVHIQTLAEGPELCSGCGTGARIKDRDRVTLADLPAFGRPARLVWHKRRFSCPAERCAAGSWTERCSAIASPRLVPVARAGRWATMQVGQHGHTVSEVASDLQCDWHTVNDAVVAYGRLLVEDPGRIGHVTALGLDEVLFGRRGRWKTKQWATSIVDVRAGRLLDVVEGRQALPACRWLEDRGLVWRAKITHASLDLSGPYRKVFLRVAAGCHPGRRSVPRGQTRRSEARRGPRAEIPGDRSSVARDSAGACSRRPSATGAAPTIRSTAPGSSWCWPRSASRRPVG